MSIVRNSAGKVALVVAVTGDSDLRPEDYQWYEAEIEAIFRELSNSYPNTPLVLLSGLAEGTDRVAISAALRLQTDIDLNYIAVLPMPEEAYRQQLKDSESNEEFTRLAAGALRIIELPVENAGLSGSAVTQRVRTAAASSSDTAEPLRSDSTSHQPTQSLGPFLVKYSQILIAILEDGNPNTNETAYTVSLKVRQESVADSLAFRMMNSNGAGPAYIIPVQKRTSGKAPAPALRRDTRFPDFSSKEDFEESYQLLDRFNRDVASKSEALKKQIEKNRQYLLEGAEAVGLSDAMHWVAAVYSRADTLAMHFANASLLGWQIVFALLAGAGICLADVHFLQGGTAALVAYYLCLIGAFGLIVWERKTKRRQRHEDYRALAEALRVQFFWMAAGLHDLAAERYLPKQSGEMVWIRDAISQCGLFDDVLDHCREASANSESQMRLAQVWVEGQAGYFVKREHENIRKKRILTTLAWIAAGVGFVAPMVGFVKTPDDIEKWCHAVAAVAMFWAALAWNYAERRGFAQEARQYGRMHQLFHAANEDLKKFERAENFPACEETIRQLGLEALQENGDWLSMHRERKLSAEIAAG